MAFKVSFLASVWIQSSYHLCCIEADQ